MTYMAPEIKEGKTYDGTQIDLFSMGVIIFIIVQGIFPFKEAKTTEYFYNLLCTGQVESYFEKINGENLSSDFKDLIVKLFSRNGADRPTICQIKSHPWMNNYDFNFEATRKRIVENDRAV